MRYCEAQYFIMETLEHVKERLEDEDYSDDNAKLTREVSEGIYMAERLEDLLEWLEDTNYIKEKL